MNAPLDNGRMWRGQRLFGPHKTWRGLISGVLVGLLVGWLVYNFYLHNYSLVQYLLSSIAMATGALVGDAVESCIKRQRGIASGSSWFPFDQTDYIVGGVLFSLPFYLLSPLFIAFIFAWYFSLHLFSSYLGYLLGFKDQPI